MIQAQDDAASSPSVVEDDMLAVLGRLECDGQLQQLLAEERMRCDLHRGNYQRLKTEFMKWVVVWSRFFLPYLCSQFAFLSCRVQHQKQSFASQLASTETARAAAQESSLRVGERARESVQGLRERVRELAEKVPTEAERERMRTQVEIKMEAR